ncbi:MAG: glutamate mutase L, partial [Erysipelothrix sp.]|nr:glutamate mutase L [Erysipelothrix sp.]
MKPILCIDFGSTYTKVVGIDVDEPRILGRTQSFTTVKEDINIGLEKAIEKLA